MRNIRVVSETEFNEELDRDWEFKVAYALFCIACTLGIIITLEVVRIVDERRADEARIQAYELRRAQEQRAIAVERCIKAAELQGLDFIQVCPDWVYDN